MEDWRLDGQVCVVTGGDSGIGRASAQALSAAGGRVVILDLKRTVSRAESGTYGSFVAVDVTDEAALRAAFDDVQREIGGVSVLIAAAGIQLADQEGPLTELAVETWNRTIDVNATGTMLAIKQALPQMIEQANGSIITLSSPTALTGRGWRYPAYSASKGAVMALTRAVALAHARQGIRANCVVPGPIQTEMTDDIFDQHGEEILARIPIGRFGQPTDLQGVMVFLASKASAYITGSIITVDGGLLAD